MAATVTDKAGKRQLVETHKSCACNATGGSAPGAAIIAGVFSAVFLVMGVTVIFRRFVRQPPAPAPSPWLRPPRHRLTLWRRDGLYNRERVPEIPTLQSDRWGPDHDLLTWL